jgi:beta-phosphoglucomutase family hydrolase
MSESPPKITPENFDAVLFDLDGVLTDTARVHAASWKEMFDAFLRRRAELHTEAFRPFEIDSDYRLYVDGRPRYDGVRDFLKSRGIELPEGGADDPPGRESVWGLGNRKNDLVGEAIGRVGVEAYPGSVRLVRHVLDQGIRTAVVSASENCAAVLEVAKIADLFEVRVDGLTLNERKLRGKPAPDSFLEAARELGVEPRRAVVIEDAISGVQAGRAGCFGLVVGVARKGDADALAENGADHVVGDLAELIQ